MGGVYRPGKDSFLLKEVLEGQELDGKKVLDVGTGSGVLAVAAARNGAEVTAVDINPSAVEEAERKAAENGLEIDARESDLFGSVDELYDIIVFNPPYVPVGEEDGSMAEKAWVGGEGGRELLDRFIAEAGDYLRDGGIVLVVQSSRNGVEQTLESFSEAGMDAEVVAEEKLHFEELAVIKARKSA